MSTPTSLQNYGLVRRMFIFAKNIVPVSGSYVEYMFTTKGKVPFTLRSNRTIRAENFNQIQTKVNSILGDGDGDTGYGQLLLSKQVQAGQTITAAQWQALRSDLAKVRQHQTGIVVGTNNTINSLNLITAEPGQVISIRLDSQYSVFADTIVNDRFRVGNIKSSEVTVLNVNQWSNTASVTVTLTQQNTTNKLRHFFNAGGSVSFNFANVITSTQAPLRSYFFTAAGRALTDTYNRVSRFFKNDATDISPPSTIKWGNILSEIGTIVFNYNAVITSDSETMLGFYNTFETEQLIYSQTSGSKAVYIYATRNDAMNQLVFRFEFKNTNAIDINNAVSISVTQQQSSNTDVVVKPLTAI